MDQIIRHITGQLIDLLPDDRQHYRLDELRTWGFPDFIVRRIRIELERNLSESMNLPQTDWANMESPAIQSIWKQFVDAIRQEARLPSSYAKTVIETAVADVVDILIQPRKNLPEVIFGADQELSYEKIKDRLDAIVVYRHFAALITRYMQKKGLQKLSRERCAELIANVDDRLTKKYSPLNWAQMLDPLFSLLGKQIDTNLLRLFFEDKKMNRLARQFDKLDASIDRALLIEVLSSPDSLNLEGFEESQSELFTKGDKPGGGEAPAKTEEKPQVPEKIKKTNGSEDRPKSKKDTSGPRRFHREDPIIGAFHEFRNNLLDADNKESAEEELVPDATVDKEEQQEDEDKDTVQGGSLNDIFGEPDNKATGISAREDNGIEDNEKFPDAEDGAGANDYPASAGPAEPTADERVETEEESSASGRTDPDKNDSGNDEETPMWKRFLSPEELAELERQETEENPGDDGFIDEPVTDRKKNPEPSGAKADALKQLMKDKRSFFVKELFRGSGKAYDDTLVNVALKKDWQSASRYIEKEVFQRNMVDMYSEAAVDFTDRMHAYFLNNPNRNQLGT